MDLKKYLDEKFQKEFKNELAEEKNNVIIPRASKLSNEQANQIINGIAKRYNINEREALVGIALLFQQGGTSRSADGNMTVIYKDQKFKLAEIRRELKECKLPRSEKKLARTLATDIAAICNELEIKGNLYNKILRQNPNHDWEEYAPWLSDFQAYNEDAPSKARDSIIQCFENRKRISNSKTKN